MLYFLVSCYDCFEFGVKETCMCAPWVFYLFILLSEVLLFIDASMNECKSTTDFECDTSK